MAAPAAPSGRRSARHGESLTGRSARHGEPLTRRPRARGQVAARRRVRPPLAPPVPTVPPVQLTALEHGLEHCPQCHADFVVPAEYAEAGERHWWMLLRCAQCETMREILVDDDAAEAFDLALDRGLNAIKRTVERLERERMTVEAATLKAALERDLIDASDFDG